MTLDSKPVATPAEHERAWLARASQTIWRHRLLVLCCVVAVPAIALAYSLPQPKTYTAEAVLHFRSDNPSELVFGRIVQAQPVEPTRQAATDLRLAKLPVVTERASRRFRGVTPHALRDKVDINPEGQSDLVSVAATDRNPRKASELANAVAEEFIRFRREADRAALTETARLVRRRLEALSPSEQKGQRGRELQRRAQELDILASLQTGQAELAQAATPPDSPSSPRPVRAGLIGAILGILLGVGIVFVLDRFDRRIHRVDEAEGLLQRPLLGAIRRLDPQASLTQVEDFSMVRANLRYFNLEQEHQVILVTSAEPGDGKTTLACNVGLAAARTGDRTLVIEADLRKPVIAERYELHQRLGLSDLLIQRAGLRDVVVAVPAHSPRGDNEHTLDVLLAGTPPPNPSELLASDAMRGLIDEVRNHYELVLIDSPPLTILPDALPLAIASDGVVAVVRLGKSKIGVVRRLGEQLKHLNARLLGIVVTDVKGGEAYGYEYTDQQATAVPSA